MVCSSVSSATLTRRPAVWRERRVRTSSSSSSQGLTTWYTVTVSLLPGQLVLHCHITLNGEVCNIPSCLVKQGDVVAVRERSKSLEVIQNSVASAAKYSWLEFDAKTLTGKFLNVPARAEIPENINEQLIVDLYSK